MNWTDPLFLCSRLTAVSFIILGMVMKRYPPKEINDFYGYRTSRSKVSQEAWDFAQVYSSELIIWVGFYNGLGAVLGLFVGLSTGWSLAVFMAILIVSCIYLFTKTESELKRRFGE